MRRKPGQDRAEKFEGPEDAIDGFVTGRMSYDALVRKLKTQIANGSASIAAVREAIASATELGRLPIDLSGILMNLFPAPAKTVDAPTAPEVETSSENNDETFDEATVPYALRARVAPAENRADDVPTLRYGEPAATDVPAGQGQSAPVAHPSSVVGSPPANREAEPAVPGASVPPVSSLPPMPGMPPLPPSPAVRPDAALPAHEDIQNKVDDVVLSALISEFQDMRQSRERSGGRADALDGLLSNYRSARFRSDARRAARGNTSGSLDLGKLDDFSGKRAGIGSILRDRFILDAEIGRGGMGIVYSAVDRRRLEARSGEPYVALKLLNDEFRNNSDALRVLEAEARKAQSLAHPNIATVFDFDRDKAEIFIVMELLSGKPLSRLLAASMGQPLPGQRIAAVLKGICAALSYAHQHGVVHSDLKPGNVFVTGDNVVKLLDFGLATANTAGGFDVSTLNALTAAYASPEMFDNAQRDPRDDIFALGCIAYQLLTGLHPFGMKASNEAAEEKLMPEPIPDIDHAAWSVISRALAFDREARLASVDEFVTGLFEA